jgi:hypothetical protein
VLERNTHNSSALPNALPAASAMIDDEFDTPAWPTSIV